jgi:hypothetical protein
MAKSIRTVAELAKAVAILKTRDAARAREIKALRGDLDIVETRLATRMSLRLPVVGCTGPENPTLSPATNSTEPRCLRDGSAHAGAAPLSRVRSFLNWLRT